MEITLKNANEYFAVGNHTMADVWLKFSEPHRAGALAHGRRMLEADVVHRPLRETDAEGDRRRDDFAAYEQALWLLLGSPYGNAGSGDAIAILEGMPSDGAAPYGGVYGNGRRERISPEALRWLGWGGVYTVRS